MKFTHALQLSAILLLLAGCSKEKHVQAKQDAAPVEISVARVVSKEVARAVDGVGTLFPFDESVISAEIEGRVDDVKVDLGDHVSVGQVMVHISDEEQRYILAQMEAQVHQALERLGLKEENDKVKDIRETPDPRRAYAELVDAQQRFARVKNLTEQGIASRADLDQSDARLKATQAGYDAALNQTRNLIQEVERTKAQLSLQRKKLRDTTVKAPFAGSVKERQVTVGQYVRVNTPLMTLVKLDPLRLRIEVPERMAPWVKTGQMVDVLIEAFEGRKFTGQVSRISPMVEQSKRTFIVEALVANKNAELKPGSYARAHIPTNKVETIQLVPMKAVQYIFGTNKAYVVKNNELIEARDIKLGDRFQNDVEVLEGLNQGDTVATTQLTKLDTGSRVHVQSGI